MDKKNRTVLFGTVRFYLLVFRFRFVGEFLLYW